MYIMSKFRCAYTLSTQSHLTTFYASRHDKTGRVISAEGIGDYIELQARIHL